MVWFGQANYGWGKLITINTWDFEHINVVVYNPMHAKKIGVYCTLYTKEQIVAYQILVGIKR